MPLSDSQCRCAKPKEKMYKLFDCEGLFLQIMPNGSKYWRLKYRLHGKEKTISFGIYPDISLQEARKIKADAKSQIRLDLDPVLARQENKMTSVFKQAQTFEAITREWFETNRHNWQKRYAQTVMHRFEKYVFPEFGNFPVSMLKPITILSCLRKIERTAPEMARRVKSLCSNVLIYAVATNRMEHDVTAGLEKVLKKYRKSHFASISLDELPQFIEILHNHKSRLSRQTYLAIRLLFLTFVRTSELLQAKWDEINFEKRVWIIPGERMKAGLTHVVPLSRQALSILNELKEMNGKREHVFPGIPYPHKSMSNGTILMALKRMGYRNKMTGHGFRSLALGVLKEKLNYSHEVADRQLAHVPKNSTDRAYDRAQFLPQRTEMMQRYADYLDEVYLQTIKASHLKSRETNSTVKQFEPHVTPTVTYQFWRS